MAIPNYLMDWANNGFSNVCYAFSDLNGDNVPELIIGCKDAQANTQAFDIWSYVNTPPFASLIHGNVRSCASAPAAIFTNAEAAASKTG